MYPIYGELFEIYTDASTRQLGAVITQNGRPIAFFSRKLSSPQTKYSVTEQELLSIVECLKEFKGMLWGQKIKVYTDHQNLVREALGLTYVRPGIPLAPYTRRICHRDCVHTWIHKHSRGRLESFRLRLGHKF